MPTPRLNLPDGRRLVVIDDFYADAQAVRDEAFELEYDQPHPLMPWYVAKSPSFYHGPAIERCERALGCQLFDTGSADEVATIGRYQFNLASAKALIGVHTDPYMWAAIVFLTPEAPLGSGTRFYRRISSGARARDIATDRSDLQATRPLDVSYDVQDFEVVMEIGNVFNRAILFDATQFHGAAGYFGTDPSNGRLTQSFFFNLQSSHRSVERNAEE